MNKKVVIGFVMTILLLSGCNKVEEKIDVAVIPSEQKQTDESLKMAAKEEGISEQQLKTLIDELSEVSAKKSGMTLKEYDDYVKSQDKTLYTIQKEASDYLGISLVEYHKYEVENHVALTDEQEEMQNNLISAGKEAEAILNSGELEEGPIDVEAMLGIHDNKTGKIRTVEGNVDELLRYKVLKIVAEDEDEYSISLEYLSNESVEDLGLYFDDLLLNTEEYLKLDPPGEMVMITGTINGLLTSAAIEKTPEGTLVETYIDLTTKKDGQ